jgi:hypothetical protein
MPSALKRTGARRLGDLYQDLVALSYLVDMLQNPTLYDWIKVEASNAGSLDDVVLKFRNGPIELYQVKFAAHPEQDPLTWTKLLSSENGGRSWLMKWAQSYDTWKQQEAALGPLRKACLLSNRAMDDELARVSNGGLIHFAAVPPDIREKIIAQIGDEAKAESFFANFRFLTDRPTPKDWEEGIRARFEHIGGTDLGWFALNKAVREVWTCYHDVPAPDGRITLKELYAAALWHRLQGLPEEFEVPEDYVPLTAFEEQVKADLAVKQGGLMIHAPAGLGKSTFLSRLFARLENGSTPVIRHHYSLSPTEWAGERLSHTRAAESFMDQIQNQILSKWPGALPEKLARRNPSARDFGLWLDAVSAYFASRNDRLVLILDGLDHVKREQDSVEELTALFAYLSPRRAGLVCLYGTQPVNPSWLTPALDRMVPTDQRYELPTLGLDEVALLAKRHVTELLGTSPAEGDAREELVNALWQKSGGHPLILKYMIQALRDAHLPVTAADVRNLPGEPNREVAQYYASLWRNLPEHSREVLHLLASCRWDWTVHGIMDCLDPEGRRNVAEGIRSVTHLLVRRAERLTPIHSSLLLWIGERPEYALYSPRLKRLALRWLLEKAPPYLRWRHACQLGREVDGAVSTALKPDDDWVMDAMVHGYPLDDARAILEAHARAALTDRDWGTWTRAVLRRELVPWFPPLFGTRSVLDRTRFLLSGGEAADWYRHRLETLSSSQLESLACAVYRDGRNPELLGAILHRLERAPGITFLGKSFIDGAVRVAALCDRSLPWLRALVQKLHDDGDSAVVLLHEYGTMLYRHRRGGLARSLLAEADPTWLTAEELAVVHHHTIPLLCGLGMALPLTEPVTEPRAALCLALAGVETLVAPALQLLAPASLDDRAKPHQWLSHEDLVLWGLLANAVLKRPQANQDWVAQLPANTSQAATARDLAGRIDGIITILRGDDWSGLWEALAEPGLNLEKESVLQLYLQLVELLPLAGLNATITPAILRRAADHGLVPMLFAEAYIRQGRTWANGEAVDWLLTNPEPHIGWRIPEWYLTTMAQLAHMHGRAQQAQEQLRLAAHAEWDSSTDNQNSRRSAPRRFLPTVDEFGRGRPEIERWAVSLAPLCGSEAVAGALLRARPERLPAFYRHAAVTGEDRLVMRVLAEHGDERELDIWLLMATAEERPYRVSDPGMAVDGLRDEDVPPSPVIKPETYPPTAAGLAALLADTADISHPEVELPLWAKYWGQQGEAEAILRTIIANGVWKDADLDTLLFQLTLRVDGADKAYQWLTRHQGRNKLTADERAAAVWPEVQRYYADRAADFAADALLSAADAVGEPAELVRYAYTLNRPEMAVAIGDAAVAWWVGEGGIERPVWADAPLEENWATAILVERLGDANTQVVQSACDAVAVLLSIPGARDETARLLAAWATAQTWESRASLPLMAWALARAKDSATVLPPPAELEALCAVPSLLTGTLERMLGLPGRDPAPVAAPATEAVEAPLPDDEITLPLKKALCKAVPTADAQAALLGRWAQWLQAVSGSEPGPHVTHSAYLRALAWGLSTGLLDRCAAESLAAWVYPDARELLLRAKS